MNHSDAMEAALKGSLAGQRARYRNLFHPNCMVGYGWLRSYIFFFSISTFKLRTLAFRVTFSMCHRLSCINSGNAVSSLGTTYFRMALIMRAMFVGVTFNSRTRRLGRKWINGICLGIYWTQSNRTTLKKWKWRWCHERDRSEERHDSTFPTIVYHLWGYQVLRRHACGTHRNSFTFPVFWIFPLHHLKYRVEVFPGYPMWPTLDFENSEEMQLGNLSLENWESC